jgi:hypothetical protein
MGNDEFRRIQDGVTAGTHIETEPVCDSASKVFDCERQLTGFDTNLGFVPKDPENRLFQLLDKAIKAGIYQVADSQENVSTIGEAESVTVCVIFGRAWPNLGGPYERIFRYRSAPECASRDLRVRLRNLPDEPNAVRSIDLILKEYDIEGIGSPIQCGILEIEIPARELSRLFRSEHHRLEPWVMDVVEDQLEQHYVRTGRSPSSGPTTDWLIPRTQLWLGRLVAGLTNTVTRTYIREYGGVPPGYVRKDVLARQAVIIVRDRGGKSRVCGIGNSGGGRLNLQGTWPDGAAMLAITNPESYPGGHKRQVLWRIRQMTEARL